MDRRIVVVGIGGASCSGKTLLAKHIRQVLPGSTIIHQDDFAPPIEQVPYSPDYPDLQDWDDPPTCILWPEFRKTMKYVREHGELPDTHLSHDHLNKQVEVEVDETVKKRWKDELDKVIEEHRGKGVEITWFIVDGFVLYFDPEIVDELDVRLFLRVPRDILKRRREERQTYVLQNPDDAAAGGVWVDPPNYFEQIVYPAYVKAHQHIFQDGDVEGGEQVAEWREPGKELVVLRPQEGEEEMTKAFESSCAEIVRKVMDII